jgi:hypothetical protein
MCKEEKMNVWLLVMLNWNMISSTHDGHSSKDYYFNERVEATNKQW